MSAPAAGTAASPAPGSFCKWRAATACRGWRNSCRGITKPPKRRLTEEWRQQKRCDWLRLAHGFCCRNDPAREWRPHTCGRNGSAGGGRLPEPTLNARGGLLPHAIHRRSRGAAPCGRGPARCGVLRRARAGDGPGAKLLACRRLRPGGAYGKRCYEEQTEILNITSRCVRSGNKRRSRRLVTQCCVMLCSGFPAQTVVRSTDAARAFTFPWGTEGDKVEVTAAQGAAVAGTKPSLC